MPVRRRRRYAAGEAARRRHAWLELLQTSGPFLTLPVVDRAWPAGLPEVAPAARAAVRTAVADALSTGGATRHTAVRTVLCEALNWGQHLRFGAELPASLGEPVPEHGLAVTPDVAFWSDASAGASDVSAGTSDGDEDEPADATSQTPWRMLGTVTEWAAHPLARTTVNGWTASPVERLAVLLRARDLPVGLVTDGRWWAVVWAPRGGTTGAAVWDASLWSEEPESFRAFVALLTRARFLAVAADDTLPALLEESLGAQEEVTETLGRQVRDAVELLLETLDRLDAESGVLDGVSDDDLYDGVVTVLMRIVFLLFAEERRLLPSDDDTYAAAYSVGRLVEQLEQAEALAGPQALEHRTGAWHRLLAVSRALHSGVAHEDLRMPAYGGTLFDPERFPWLEGRAAGDPTGARPPAVDDRTVLRLLRAVQYVEVGGERRRLTFRALDVEQIGYVYEGLLELEVRTADEVVLSLVRPPSWPKGKAPAEVPLSEAVERLGSPSGPTMAEWVASRTGWSASRLAKVFETPLEVERRAALLRAVGDADIAAGIEPYAGVLRWDEPGRPSVTLPGRRYVAPSSRRASTGTHYTPRSLAEDVAGYALEALVFRPGPLETADRSTWRIRPSSELLDLRVADIAMGSGAFLVAACRYLADRLVEAWEAEGRPDALLASRHRASGRVAADAEVEQVALEARRMVAEHCLYGVDVNPLAVEMAKLSLWLITMDRERPFGFLDDRLVTGDSLLGLASLSQLTTLHAHPDGGEYSLDTAMWEKSLGVAADLRRQITAHPVVNARDVAHKASLLRQARALTENLVVVADAVTGVGLRAASLSGRRAGDAFRALSWRVSTAGDDLCEALADDVAAVQAGRPAGVTPRVPLHWPVVFPEVFADSPMPGFDAIIGNPPFLGGKKISGAMGDDYLAWLARWDGRGVRGNADLAARFVLRAERLLSDRGQLGYIATNTLVQGDTLEVGLAEAARRGLAIRRGAPSHPWPSASANLEIVDVWASRAPVAADGLRVLGGEEVPAIGADLEPVGRVKGRPQRLPENDGIAFIGSYVLGLGFTMTKEQAQALITRDPRNAEALQPYVVGQDLNSRPDCSASRWIVNFREWALERAKGYPDLLAILDRDVRPERQRKDAAKYPRMVHEWWKFFQNRPGLERAVTNLEHALALSLVSSVVMPVRVPTGPVFAHKCAVFALDDFAGLAVLSSSAHTTWVVRYSSTLETRINYSPSDVFLTLPRPEPTPDLYRLGERLDTERRALMLGRSWGLTTTYNHVHDPAVRDPEVVALRDLHAEIDAAVMAAYGWDLDLEIGHHPTKIGTRWTVSRRARFELLDLLLEENHRRAGLLP
jgi:hypothetical protein